MRLGALGPYSPTPVPYRSFASEGVVQKVALGSGPVRRAPKVSPRPYVLTSTSIASRAYEQTSTRAYRDLRRTPDLVQRASISQCGPSTRRARDLLSHTCPTLAACPHSPLPSLASTMSTVSSEAMTSSSALSQPRMGICAGTLGDTVDLPHQCCVRHHGHKF